MEGLPVLTQGLALQPWPPCDKFVLQQEGGAKKVLPLEDVYAWLTIPTGSLRAVVEHLPLSGAYLSRVDSTPVGRLSQRTRPYLGRLAFLIPRCLSTWPTSPWVARPWGRSANTQHIAIAVSVQETFSLWRVYWGRARSAGPLETGTLTRLKVSLSRSGLLVFTYA